MYRRVVISLPKEPVFPYNLTQLGYFINDRDEVKSVANPEEDFKYKVSKNERYNDLRKEAYTSCLRKVVLDRLAGTGMKTILLPLGAEESQPHVPILVSKELQKRSRVVIVFGSPNEDLGIWCYRKLGSNGCSISAGSAVDLVKRLSSYHASETETPGVIIANTGQLLWHRKGKRAVSFNTWNVMPRKSAVSKGYRIDDKKNRVPGNEDPDQHIQYVFNTVVMKLVDENAGLDIIASAGGMDVLKFLDDNWSTWKDRINAIALANPLYRISDILDENLRQFLKKRGRAYIANDEPLGSLLCEPQYGCAVYSSGEPEFAETILSTTHELILDFFHAVATDQNFINPEILIFGGERDTDSQGVDAFAQELASEDRNDQGEGGIFTHTGEDNDDLAR
ncbi:hypothetical protein GP486_000992 [Trichoglossum hirsutum]|uniref:Arb2 domain-containing protein n=1 Tax=Trichoglossum hirsutum TaxID=265104 RepID=A0A9P8LHN7_9PEZI|nr:hypothetical protein GP486_000992 [Trichoglossum hirsutum]